MALIPSGCSRDQLPWCSPRSVGVQNSKIGNKETIKRDYTYYQCDLLWSYVYICQWIYTFQHVTGWWLFHQLKNGRQLGSSFMLFSTFVLVISGYLGRVSKIRGETKSRKIQKIFQNQHLPPQKNYSFPYLPISSPHTIWAPHEDWSWSPCTADELVHHFWSNFSPKISCSWSKISVMFAFFSDIMIWYESVESTIDSSTVA